MVRSRNQPREAATGVHPPAPDLQRSVLRRSSYLVGFVVPALFLNLGLIYVATRLLSAEAFGIFYLANTVVNVLFAPAIILNLHYSRYFVRVATHKGHDAALHAVRRFVGSVVRWGAAVSAAAFAALYALGIFAGAQSPLLILAVTVTTYVSYVADTARCALQGLQQFFRLGLYTLSWGTMRFLLGSAGLYLAGTVWAGLLGMIVGAVSVFGLFYRRLRAALGGTEEARDTEAPTFGTLMPMALAYGLFIGISYLDIILAYIVLQREGLGVYAGASVVPKGLLIFTFPLIQVAFPMMVREGERARIGPTVIAKSIVGTLVLAAGTAAVALMASGQICGGPYGIVPCDRELMTTLLLAAVPLCALRVLIAIQFARGLDWHPLALIVPTAIYAWLVLSSSPDMGGIAMQYFGFSYILLGYYVLLCLTTGRSWKWSPCWRRR